MSLTVAVDVASAQIRACLFNIDNSGGPPIAEGLYGELWSLSSHPIIPDVGDEICKIAQRVAGNRVDEVRGVGVAYAGAVQLDNRVYPHLPDGDPSAHGNVAPVNLLNHIGPKLRNTFGQNLEVAVANRSDMGAWGESQYGQGHLFQAENLVYLTLGGIIGAGIVIKGNLFLGDFGFAGEFGHILIDPTSPHKCEWCGKKGCLSSIASARALVREVGNDYQKNPDDQSLLAMGTEQEYPQTEPYDAGHWETVKKPGASKKIRFDAKTVLSYAATQPENNQPKQVQQIVEQLGRLVAQIVTTLDIRLVVLGGGAVHHSRFEFLLAEQARKYLPWFRLNRTSLELSSLDDQAALYGVAHWVWSKR